MDSITHKHPARKLLLTELAIRKAEPGARPYTLWDAKQHGLGLRVQPRSHARRRGRAGGKSWYEVYSIRGRPRWLYLGNAAAIGLADARMLAAEVMLAVAKGGDPGGREAGAEEQGDVRRAGRRSTSSNTARSTTRAWRQGAYAGRARHAMARWGKLPARTPSAVGRREGLCWRS